VVAVPHGLGVTGDATRLTQIAMNVLSNAAKYTPPGGRIHIDASHTGEVIELRLKDNGIGISSEMLPHVFEMFAQERQPLHRADGGLGLGLTIVKRLVERHGGTVTLHSEGMGHGCEVVIRLPKAAEAAVADVANDGAPAAHTSRAGYRILVVDDNIDAARTMADALGLAGYETRVSFDGPAALNTASTFKPDAVLLDLGLPLMDGYEVAEAMLASTSDRKPVLVAVTGYGQKSDRDKTRAAGFSSHVVKPIEMPSLVAVLERLLPRDQSNQVVKPTVMP
jgi:CheY-like chemotaxis protein/anti-sigma regulatory factor (Ser/Thr protein kinase)